jgi:hypothetical protein
MTEQQQAWTTARVWQPLVCLSILATIGLSSAVMATAVQSEALGIWMDRKWSEANETCNEYKRQFLDTEDRVVLEDIPGLDPSAGGVYFFGASNMKWAMRAPDLPPEQRKLVHNFGAGEGAPYFHQQFTDFLVNYKNILTAGPDKTLIVYGTSFLNAKPASDGKTVFSNMWQRYGLYRYDFHSGIEPVDHGTAWGAYALEKARVSSFVQGLMDRGERLALPKALRRRNTAKDAAVYAADYQRRMGADWEEALQLHRQELQHWFDDLRSQKVEFRIVLLPLASWHKPLPYPRKYRAMIEDFCRSNHVRLIDLVIDLENLVTDDDFLDHIHMNEIGLPKTDAALMDIARKFLKEKGVWPSK